jgi:hypothetical protein
MMCATMQWAGRSAALDMLGGSAAGERSVRRGYGQPAAAYCSRKYASSASAARLSTRVLERTV